MFRMIRNLISLVFTVIFIGMIIYFFKFSIKDNSFCISLRHKEHQVELKNATKKLKKSLENEKKDLGKKIVNSIIDTGDENGTDNKERKSKKEKEGDITIEQIIKNHE